MSATINKQLNDIFEEVYHLFNDSIMVPEYLNRSEIERCVFEFMDKISIHSEWNMTDDERSELQGKYFEAESRFSQSFGTYQGSPQQYHNHHQLGRDAIKVFCD